MKRWSLRTLQDKLIKIGAKVVTHSPRIIFQMAEVAVPRMLFEAILKRIGELAPAVVWQLGRTTRRGVRCPREERVSSRPRVALRRRGGADAAIIRSELGQIPNTPAWLVAGEQAKTQKSPHRAREG